MFTKVADEPFMKCFTGRAL